MINKHCLRPGIIHITDLMFDFQCINGLDITEIVKCLDSKRPKDIYDAYEVDAEVRLLSYHLDIKRKMRWVEWIIDQWAFLLFFLASMRKLLVCN